MKIIKIRYFRALIAAFILTVTLTGAAIALTQITKELQSTVTVALNTPDGLEVYLDSDLTQVAESIDFGDLVVDLFGTVEAQNTVRVWVQNLSFSDVQLTLDDDYPNADVVIVGGNQQPTLGPGDVLPVDLELRIDNVVEESASFSVFFNAEGPLPVGPVTPMGAVTMVVAEVGDQFGDFPVQPYGSAPGTSSMGYYDHLLVHDGSNPHSPWVAEAWSINSSGDELTLNIRQGIKFNTPSVFGNANYGELTAEDVAWNMNRQNAVVNPGVCCSKGGQLGATFGEAQAVDPYTVKVPMVTDIFWGIPITEFDINDTSVTLASKTAYETEGAAAVRNVPVGSGPFTIGEWIANDRGTVEAVPSHWAETSNIDTFTVVQVPDTQSRMAMMQTGQADLGEIDFGRIRQLPGIGLKFFPTMSDADTMTLGVIWPGNLWTDTNAKNQQGIQPWLSSVYDEDLPHLGNPWCDLGKPCRYTDTNNPPGISDMEQARLVRWALGMAIDREEIVEELQGGFGTPIYLELMGPKFPGWRPNRTVNAATIKANHEKYSDSQVLGPGTSWVEYNVTPAEPNYEWPWTTPTDIIEANRLLDLAGFPKGSNGVRFEISLNKYRCETGPVCLEQADAVAASWEELGVRTTLLAEEYGAVVVPRMRDRTQAWPVVKNCSVETANYPFDWPPPPSDSTFSRPAWGCSFENKFLDYMFININGERNQDAREALHLDMVDYYYYWQLYSGISNSPRGVAGNPQTIESWNSRSTASGFWGRPQHIVTR